MIKFKNDKNAAMLRAQTYLHIHKIYIKTFVTASTPSTFKLHLFMKVMSTISDQWVMCH